MKTLRIAQAALATILVVGINSNSHAFMAVDQTAAVQVDLTEMVDSLRNEIATGQTKCDDMLAKLDAALEDIDAKLDAGVANEEEYLTARDAIAQMRYDLECVAKDLTHEVVDVNGNMIPHDHQMGDGGMMPGGGNPVGNGGGSFGTGGNGGASVGGGFSSGASAGSSGGGLAALAIVGGGIAAAVDDNNDRIGFVGSESQAVSN
jgi:hypothetical protein